MRPKGREYRSSLRRAGARSGIKARTYAGTRVVRATFAPRGLVALCPAPSPRRPSVAAGFSRLCSTAAFTIVELIVVISVIVLLLGIAVPGLNAIAAQSRFSAAVQITNGALTQAYTAALADLNMTAVRFVPAQWDNDPSTNEASTAGRQHIVTYSFTPTTAGNPATPGQVVFGEYFQRRPGTPSVILPEDVWVAPLEALEMGSRVIKVRNTQGAPLEPQQRSPFGQQLLRLSAGSAAPPGEFVVDAADVNQRFYQADDFLIIFDPRLGLRSTGVIEPNRLRGYIPAEVAKASGAAIDSDGVGTYGSDWEPFQRYNFSGVTLYHRSAFLNATRQSDPAMRQNWLRENSRPFLIHRFGGGLVSGAQSEGEQP